MPNMSYCRFRNTLLDLKDCYDYLVGDEEVDDDISDEELRAKKQLIDLCRDITERVDYLEEDNGCLHNFQDGICKICGDVE